MGDSTDGEREDMQWQEVSKKRRDWSDSSGHSGSEFGKESKKVKANGASVRKEDDTAEWKVVIAFKNEGAHYHPLKLTKAIEKEIGKIKFAKFLSNRRLLIFATDQRQREKILRAETLNGERISSHIPGSASRLRGVIQDVPLSMAIDEIIQEVKGGKIVKASRLQICRNGKKTDSLAVLLEFEKVLAKKIRRGYMR